MVATEEKVDGGGVIHLLGVHAFDEAEVIGDGGGVRDNVADPGSALPALLEGLECAEEFSFISSSGHSTEALSGHVAGGDLLAVHFGKQRFVIEKLEVAGSAVLKEDDDALGLGCELGDGGGDLLGVG